MLTSFDTRNDLGHGPGLVGKTKRVLSRQDPMCDVTRCAGVAPQLCAPTAPKGVLIST
ncbi:MAG: hypothetical protein HN810_11500 [Acidiferrobacteraceae bacterium]|nr:hypothetical protein [Acidiferrobacteraceae bacterium]MBT5345339.1 hypothetical protein [Acidiferrobacteraceae bacterium]MBT5886747.1 hypothetical protein [Acidiferrobacteraceae bacterium]MBT7354730.1 hypothetical protein [Acidiferrobacteraceae bacterium]